jgi:type IV secretion system protein VirB10
MLAWLLLGLLFQGPRDIQVAPDRVVQPADVVPAGTVIPVSLLNRLSTKNIKEGDGIYARTIFPITANNRIVIPEGTNVRGKVVSTERPGRVKGKASLTISFQTMILPNGYTIPIYGSLGGSDTGHREGEATIEGESTKGRDAGDIAKAGAAGGIVGGIVRGRRGAAIGGGVSAGVALAGVLLSRGEDLTLDRGTVIEIVLDEAIEP